MRIQVSSVEEVGLAIRAMRKVGGVRQDDVPGVSHMFLRDLEHGKQTVQFGRVLQVFQELGIHMVLEVPDSAAARIQQEMGRHIPKVVTAHTRIDKKDAE